MNSIRVDYLIGEARDLALALESGEVAVDDLPATVVASLRRALCQLPGVALLATYPHLYAVEFGDSVGLCRIKVTPQFDDGRVCPVRPSDFACLEGKRDHHPQLHGGWDAGWDNYPTIDEAMDAAHERAASSAARRDAEARVATATERTEAK